MSARCRLDAALDATKDWHASLPETRAFCPWPDDLSWAGLPPCPGPAGPLIRGAPGHAPRESAALLAALQAIAEDVEWRLTYTAAEVGQHFLDQFGWFELAGPLGHFTTHQTRITVGYWGPGLDYPRHQHPPEELYTVVSGEALFALDDAPDLTLGPGQSRLHPADQPHAMRTLASPVLTVVFWRGQGLAEPPRLSA